MKPGPLRLVRQVERLRWELAIARRDAKADAVMRRNAERRAERAERYSDRLERRIRRLVRVLMGRPRTRGKRKRRTWLTDAIETTALPAHRWEALKNGGMIR